MRWIRALWAWWFVLTALGLGLIVAAFFNASMFRLKEREANVTPKIEQVKEAFAPLRKRQLDVPLAILTEFEQGRLTLERLNAQRLVGQPFIHLWVIDKAGKLALAGDREEPPPAWIVKLINDVTFSEGGLVPLRPMDTKPHPGRPASYMVWVAKDAQGRFLVSPTDIDYIFGRWLKRQVEALKRGTTVD
jgi:hypothetical protein